MNGGVKRVQRRESRGEMEEKGREITLKGNRWWELVGGMREEKRKEGKSRYRKQ